MILDNVYQCSSELTESSEIVEILTDIAENQELITVIGSC